MRSPFNSQFPLLNNRAQRMDKIYRKRKPSVGKNGFAKCPSKSLYYVNQNFKVEI